MPSYTVRDLDLEVRCDCCGSALAIMQSAHKSVRELFSKFNMPGGIMRKPGRPREDEQDLLRAMIVFAGAGLDAMLKQLARDAIPVLVQDESEENQGVRRALREWVRKQVRGPVESAAETGAVAGASFVANVLTDSNPLAACASAWVDSLTGSSLQSVDELCRACDAFGLDDNHIMSDKSIIKHAFNQRNAIVHEMDIKRGGGRNTRIQKDVIAVVNSLLELGAHMLAEVDARAASAEERARQEPRTKE